MNVDQVALRVEEYIRTAFAVDANDPGLGRETDLFDRGYVDSVGFVELLEFLREEFGVEVSEDEMLSDEFGSIDGIARIVGRRV